MVKQQEPTDRIAQVFAKEISAELEKGCNGHLFQNLILVVEPHFLGKIRAALSKKTLEMVTRTLHKDLAHIPNHQLHQFIWPKKRPALSSDLDVLGALS